MEMSPFCTVHTTSGVPIDVLSMALPRVVSEIFTVEKCRDLEMSFKVHSRSLKVVPFDRLCSVSY